MERTLIFELSAASLRLFAAEQLSSCIELDITGGYGKKTIPLYIHYSNDGELPLIGEDALLYEEIEERFVESAFAHPDYFYDFIAGVLSKCSAFIAKESISRLVFLYSDFLEEETLKALRAICWDGYETPQWIPFVKCIEGYIASQKEALNDSADIKNCNGTKISSDVKISSDKTKTQFLYMDGQYAYCVSYRFDVQTIHKVMLPLSQIDAYFLEYLAIAHGLSTSDYRVLKLYESQKSFIQQSVLIQKDISVYSNIQYPPQKIRLSYNVIFEFIRQWESEFSVEFLLLLRKMNFDTMEFIGNAFELPIIKNILGSRLKEVKRNPEALILGALFYSEHLRRPDLFMKSYQVRCDDRFIDVITAGETFVSCHRTEFVLTGKVNTLTLIEGEDARSDAQSLHQCVIESERTIQIIDYIVCFDEEQKVSEVRYEVRRS